MKFNATQPAGLSGRRIEGSYLLCSSFILAAVAIIMLQIVTTGARAQTLPSISGSIILNGESLDQFKLMGRQQELASVQVVEATGQHFSQALRVSTKAGAQSEWNAQLFAPIKEPVNDGDVLMARFWMRCTESMTGEGFVGFVYEKIGRASCRERV